MTANDSDDMRLFQELQKKREAIVSEIDAYTAVLQSVSSRACNSSISNLLIKMHD